MWKDILLTLISNCVNSKSIKPLLQLVAFINTAKLMAYQPIENYGIIGDLNTVALVGLDGSIDFMCFPDFDSPTIFGKVLDDGKGGSFEIVPLSENIKHKQLYLPDTNVLITRFLSADGVAELTDFMPVEELYGGKELIRRVTCIQGQFDFECAVVHVSTMQGRGINVNV